jgi:transcriptional regulator NrdR family protein
MIISLEIQNFQSHEETKLDFHKGVNVIVGSSDGGKTAIIRALRWVVWNRPSGNAIRSWWGGETRVCLGLENGEVVRSKDRSDLYRIHSNRSDQGRTSVGEETEFKAFGTSVPEEISRFLNISEVNLQQQLDSPFLLSKTPGEVASYFNKIAKLDKIDIGQKNIQSWIRSLKSDITYQEEHIKTLKEDVIKFDYLEKAETELEALEELESRSKSLALSHNKLLHLRNSYGINEVELNKIESFLEIEETLTAIFELKALREKRERDYIRLSSLAKTFKSINEELQKIKKLVKLESPIAELLALYDEKLKADEEYNQLYRQYLNIKQTERSIIEADEQYKNLAKEFNRVFPDVCPLCGLQVIHDHDIII